MDDGSAGARRVGVLDRPAPRIVGEDVLRDWDGPPAEQAFLLRLLQEVSDSVRAGAYVRGEGDGVLLDTVVGSNRYVLMVQEATLAVRLSPREQEIARMVANGRTNSAIAAALEISVWTVSTHLRRIFAKLAVGSRAEMVAHLGQTTIGQPTVGQTTTVIPPST